MKQTLHYWNYADYKYSLHEYIECLIDLNHRIDNVIITHYSDSSNFAMKSIIITSEIK